MESCTCFWGLRLETLVELSAPGHARGCPQLLENWARLRWRMALPLESQRMMTMFRAAPQAPRRRILPSGPLTPPRILTVTRGLVGALRAAKRPKGHVVLWMLLLPNDLVPIPNWRKLPSTKNFSRVINSLRGIPQAPSWRLTVICGMHYFSEWQAGRRKGCFPNWRSLPFRRSPHF